MLFRSGGALSRVTLTFSNITNTDTNDRLQELATEIWPQVTAVNNSINFNEALFERVSAVRDAAPTLDLDEQDLRLIELTYRGFERAGATQSAEVKDQVAAINKEMSSLTTQFSQNLLASTKAFKLEVTDEAELAGLSDSFKAAIKDGDKWVLTVDRSVYETFMAQSENRDLRQQMFDGYRLGATPATQLPLAATAAVNLENPSSGMGSGAERLRAAGRNGCGLGGWTGRDKEGGKRPGGQKACPRAGTGERVPTDTVEISS